MIIGLHGKARSGKDTVADIIVELTKDNGVSRWIKKAFADKMKLCCAIITDTPIKHWYMQSMKSQNVKNWNIEYRQFMQLFGTEACRRNIVDDIWVRALLDNYNSCFSWIITDIRFKNELNEVKNRNSILIKIERELSDRLIHQSETDLDDYYDWDYIIQNDSTKEDLIEKVKSILIKENILIC